VFGPRCLGPGDEGEVLLGEVGAQLPGLLGAGDQLAAEVVQALGAAGTIRPAGGRALPHDKCGWVLGCRPRELCLDTSYLRRSRGASQRRDVHDPAIVVTSHPIGVIKRGEPR
jgi:hypothetical protein